MGGFTYCNSKGGNFSWLQHGAQPIWGGVGQLSSSSTCLSNQYKDQPAVAGHRQAVDSPFCERSYRSSIIDNIPPLGLHRQGGVVLIPILDEIKHFSEHGIAKWVCGEVRNGRSRGLLVSPSDRVVQGGPGGAAQSK